MIIAFISTIFFTILDKRAENFKQVLEEEYNADEDEIVSESEKSLNINSDEYDTPKKKKVEKEKYSCKRFGKDLVDSLKQIKEFNLLFWIVTIITTLYFCCIYTFMNFAETFLNVNYGYDTVAAGR